MKNQFAQKNKADLEKELIEKRISIRDIRFGMAGSKNKNVKEQKTIRKDIARIMTVLNISNSGKNK